MCVKDGLLVYNITCILHMLLSDGSIQDPTVEGKQTTQLLNHNFVFLLCLSEWIWSKQYNTDYSCKLLGTFKVLPKVVNGVLTKTRKTANTSGITWPATLVQPMLNILEQDCQHHDFDKMCAHLYTTWFFIFINTVMLTFFCLYTEFVYFIKQLWKIYLIPS
jgi:hypothetical protein